MLQLTEGCVSHVLRAKLACDACIKAAKKTDVENTFALVIKSMPHINFGNFFFCKTRPHNDPFATLTTRIPGVVLSIYKHIIDINQ